ncbi:peptidase domain-containing ABC transporter [Hellea balneolensis]|uniref:peptidase domain-containing ABC transporter n=1 Tax=Hellea balneolensis TaxID=287478 RepID=UPI0004165518|nr:peptidase domain-containing ABC transporter [Hellea balneolensis]
MFGRKTLPVILQTEMTECGLACLAMIGQYHGHNIDLNVLRKRHLVSMTGASLKSIIAIAGGLQLAARPLKVDLDQLEKLQLPAILHWDLNHYVVLKSVKGDKVQIVDPGIGLRNLKLSQVSDHFTGIALELTPTAEFSPIDARLKPHLSLLWSRLVGLKRAIFQTLTLSVILQIIVLAAPFYLQLVVDGALAQNDYGLLKALALGFGGLMILRAVSEAVRSWAILVYGNQMSLQMVGNVFRHLIRLPTSYFEKRHVGDIISRMGSSVPIQEALTQSIVAVLIDGVMAILMLIILYLYSPLLGTIILISVLLLTLSTLLIYPHLRRTQEESIYAKAVENTHVIESIRASTTVKLFGREAQREAAWRNLYTDFINTNVEYGKFTIWQKFAETLLTGLQIVIVVWAAAMMMMDGNAFTLGMLVAFLAYRQYFTDSVTQLLQKGIEFRLLSLHLDRLSDIIFSEEEQLEDGEAGRAEFKGHIELENISFRYSDTDRWIFDDYSLAIEPGQMTTLTGLSGGGKTTLMKLILGLYEPTKGRILIDGRPLQEIGIRRWREHIGVVMQDDKLLSGTIADNISFFDPEMDMKKVAAAARKAQIHDEIMAIPMHYTSMVGDMGSILSGGQKQRVLLARALYHEPSVLFLDEGTANLDAKTEEIIVDIIAKMPITRLIVAHRPAFIQRSNQVLHI